MYPEREVSIGELAEDVRDLADAVRALSLSIETTYVRRDVYDLAHAQLIATVDANNRRHDAEIAAIEQRQTLIARTAVTALLLPLITVILGALLVGSFT
jgi:hypothetical protein